MALTVTLEDERGTVIDELLDPQNVVVRLIEPSAHKGEIALLQYVDPYADTIFNRLQMRDVLRDITTLMAKANDDAIAIVEKLSELAERCTREPHLYLKFHGD